MTGPAVVYSLLIATAAAALYHLLFGRSARQLLLFWATGVAGFTIGQLLAGPLGLRMPMLGSVHVFEGLVGAVLLMSIVKLLRL